MQLQHRRAHNLLLISKLLSGRDASPFTLVIDSLEQSSKPVIREFTKRANLAKTRVIYVSFETLKKPKNADVFISASNQTLQTLQKEISVAAAKTKCLLIFDSLNTLASDPSANLPALLSSLISPLVSLLAVYHQDIPLWLSHDFTHNPHPLTLLKYLSTAIFTTHSFSHVLAQKSARDRSLAEPVFGISEEIEGVIQGLGSNEPRGIVLEMEYRRKSGRGVREWFFLPSITPTSTTSSGLTRTKEIAILLEDHPLYRHVLASGTEEGGGGEGMISTFSLELTEKQKRDREGVVLPYFDAQKEGGVGEGGRILYDMGEEDDFDEEEDEI